MQKKYATISLLLPQNMNVDVYIDGNLIQSNVAANTFQMKTPDLPDGIFKYSLTIRDSANSTRNWSYEVRGIQAGGTINVDLTEVS